MKRRFWVRLLAPFIGLLVADVGAAGSLTASVAATAPMDVPTLIKQVQDATLRRNFSGIFVVSAGGQLSSSRITHYCDGQNQIDRIESLDGQIRQIFRHNDEVHILWPRTQQASVERRDAVHSFPDTPNADAGLALEQYDIQPGGEERIAGHDTRVVLLKPRDTHRFAQRWWLERQSGLLLRTDLLGEHGEVLESAAFSTLQIGIPIQPQPLLQEMHKLDGYKVTRRTVAHTSLDREGWSLRPPVAGFRPVSFVRRPGSPVPALHASANAPPPVAEPGTILQAVYSDGLTQLSLFIEPYRVDSRRAEIQLAMGATHAITRRLGDWWITAVGDVPPLTLRQFANALERRKP